MKPSRFGICTLGRVARAGLTPVGTHGIRHRAATDIANSGIPVKVGMVLTAHKTVTMFMRYVHTEENPVRAAADTVALRRQTLIGKVMAASAPGSAGERILAPSLIKALNKELGERPIEKRTRTQGTEGL